MDAHNLFGYSTLAASAASGATTITIADTAAFPDPASVGAYNAVIWTFNQKPLSSNAEVVRVTAKAGAVYTITRAQEGSTAKAFASGDEIANAVTPKLFTDIETPLAATISVANAASAEIAAHEADTVDAHDASAISVADAGNVFTATEVEAALQEVKLEADALPPYELIIILGGVG